MKSLVENSDLPLIGEYRDVETGTSSDRANYQRMLEDARHGNFSHIATEEPARFGRNDGEALVAIDELDELGIAVRFANHPELDPTNSDERVMVSLVFSMARRESLKIGERSSGGIEDKQRRGGQTGVATDGYLNKKEEVVGPNKEIIGRTRAWIEPDPDRWHIWREAWDLLLTGEYTLKQICIELHARGYTYRSGRAFIVVDEHEEIEYATNGLWRIFRNAFYAGWVISKANGIERGMIRGNWKPLVTDEEFDRGLEILTSRSKRRVPEHVHFYLLKGLVFLQRAKRVVKLTCSTSNTKRSGGGTAYYRHVKSKQRFLCSHVDAQISHHLRTITIEPDLIPLLKKAYKVHLQQTFSAPEQEIQRLQQALKDIKQEEIRLSNLYIRQQISDDVWDCHWHEWETRRKLIRQKLRELQQIDIDAVAMQLDDALHLTTQIAEVYGTLSGNKQQELLRLVVGQVVIDDAGTILRLELLPPFAYLNDLQNLVKKILANSQKQKSVTSTSNAPKNRDEKCSTFVSFCGEDRIRTCGSV